MALHGNFLMKDGVLSLGFTERNNITDDDLQRLTTMVNPLCIRGLDLTGSQITDAGLVHVAQFKALENLQLAGTKITNSGLRSLSGLTSLRKLNLMGTKAAELCGLSLSDLPHLEELDIERAFITPLWVELLQTYRLKMLRIKWVSCWQEGLEKLYKLTPKPTVIHLMGVRRPVIFAWHLLMPFCGAGSTLQLSGRRILCPVKAWLMKMLC